MLNDINKFLSYPYVDSENVDFIETEWNEGCKE